MHFQHATFALLGLLIGAHARSSVASRTTESRADKIVARVPPIPTSTLITDFQKDGVNSSWAEGHPKIWDDASVNFQGPGHVDVSADEKFVVIASGRNLTIRDISTQDIASSVLTDAYGNDESVAIFPDVDEGYSVFVATSNSTGDRITRFRFSSDGEIVGEQTQYEGTLSTFDGRHGPFSEDGRRFLAIDHRVQRVSIYDVDGPGSNVTLIGHTDRVVSAAFSPDGALVSTASWDSHMKLWNASTGELVHSFGPMGGQTWKTNFSPDGKYVVLGSAGAQSALRIWSVANLTAPPIVVGNFGQWIRTASWTSDSKFIAAGTYGIVQVYSMDEKRIVQRWQTEDPRYEMWDLFWIEEESGLKLAYRITAGLEVYDFEANLKYRWGPHAYEQYNGGGSGDDTTLIKSRGWIGGSDADRNVRFYDFPV